MLGIEINQFHFVVWHFLLIWKITDTAVNTNQPLGEKCQESHAHWKQTPKHFCFFHQSFSNCHPWKHLVQRTMRSVMFTVTSAPFLPDIYIQQASGYTHLFRTTSTLQISLNLGRLEICSKTPTNLPLVASNGMRDKTLGQFSLQGL